MESASSVEQASSFGLTLLSACMWLLCRVWEGLGLCAIPALAGGQPRLPPALLGLVAGLVSQTAPMQKSLQVQGQ